MRRVFGLRFAVEAAAIVAVAVAVWYERLSRVAIVATMAGAWLVLAVVEWTIGRRAGSPEDEPVAEDEPEEEPSEPEPEPEPPPELAADGDGAEAPEVQPAADAASAGGGPEWNVWDLERLAREGAGSDVTRDEEREFLLMYLRDFAGPDGQLPAHFDDLVRDSFGDLIPGSRR